MEQEPIKTDSESDTSIAETGMDAEEAKLVQLLTTLRVEATPEADFEARFLFDLHERIEHEAVCRPARTLLWEHISQFIVNIGYRRRVAIGTTAICAFALCSAYFAWTPGEFADVHAEAALTNRLESTLSSLKPGVAKDVTRISVGRPSAVSSLVTPSALRTPVLFTEAEDSYESSAYSHPEKPVNMGLSEEEHVTMPAIGL